MTTLGFCATSLWEEDADRQIPTGLSLQLKRAKISTESAILRIRAHVS
jgi:hypothetical protein